MIYVHVVLFISKYHKKSGLSYYMIYLTLPVSLLHVYFDESCLIVWYEQIYRLIMFI